MIIQKFVDGITVSEAIWGQKLALLMSTPVCQSGMGLQPQEPLEQPLQETWGLREPPWNCSGLDLLPLTIIHCTKP